MVAFEGYHSIYKEGYVNKYSTLGSRTIYIERELVFTWIRDNDNGMLLEGSKGV